jgi:hypothetical protein
MRSPKNISVRLRSVVVLEHGYDILNVYNALTFAIEASPDEATAIKFQAIIERLFIEPENEIN